MKVRWLARAADDLAGIAEYLEEHASPGVAERILVHIFEGVNGLETMPYKGRPTGVTGYRQLVFAADGYVVNYRIVNDTVHVLRIRHAARRPLAH